MGLFDKGGDSQAKALASQQRRTLAELARSKGEADQAGASGGKSQSIGGQLLTFLKLGQPKESLG